MQVTQWPTAIAAATGARASWVEHALRRLREASLVPSGRNPPPFSAREIARVLLGLCVDHLPTLAEEVLALEAAPSRTVPTYGTPTAGDALARLVERLLADAGRAFGAVEVNIEQRDITVHTIDDNSLPVVARFGDGDNSRYGHMSTTVVIPLPAVRALARVLTER